MASKKNTKPTETDGSIEDQTEAANSEAAETDGSADETAESAADEAESEDVGADEPVLNPAPATPTDIHERLEDAELAAMTGSPDKAHALNRITLLTGALKTALPEAIKHADEPLKTDLQSLLGLL